MRAAWVLALFLTACHSSSRDDPVDPQLTPGVQAEAVLNDSIGTVTVSWTAYAGEQPFAEYWVLRNAVLASACRGATS